MKRHVLTAAALMLIAAGLLALCALVSLTLPLELWRPEPPAQRSAGVLDVGAPRRLSLVRFFAACALMQASDGAYYTFYSIRLQDLGHGGATIGALWALHSMWPPSESSTACSVMAGRRGARPCTAA